jgi:uncharacterized protein YqgQ
MARVISAQDLEPKLIKLSEEYSHTREAYLLACRREEILPKADLLEIKYKGLQAHKLRDIILLAIGSEPVSIKEILSRVQSTADRKFDIQAIRNEISKLCKSNILEREGTGTYSLNIKNSNKVVVKEGKIIVLEE